MISRRILAALALLCAFSFSAQAQPFTKSQLNSQIGVNFPDNTTFSITPLNERTIADNIVNSIMPTAPVGAGNLACFSGTTGLLQDCGSAPLGVQLANTVYAGPTTGSAATPTFRALVGADLPVPGLSSLGGVFVASCNAHQWLNAITNTGGASCGQPAIGDISGLGTGNATVLGVATGSPGGPVQTIASGSTAMATTAIGSAACATVVTASASGVLTSDRIEVTSSADLTGVTGFTPSTSGGLSIYWFPTVNNVNFKVCNPTTSTITPSAVTLNWGVVR